MGSDTETEASGLQFARRSSGGLLGPEFRSRSGLPVINLPGCPCHGDVLSSTLAALKMGAAIDLTEWNSPQEWYGRLVHQGCLRNEYHEYRVEDGVLGGKGCLFFHLGCRGPVAHGPCNKLVWNGHTTKTRVGAPCVGCTMPDFPREHGFFSTPSIAGVPLELPEGVDRAHYLAYKSMAAAAAPDRLKKQLTRL
jgi:hydrogenase small subunit